MQTERRDRSAIYASRLHSRRPLDVRARVVALHSPGDRSVGHGVTREGVKYSVVHARTRDVSQTGAGLTLTRELRVGSEVVLCFRLPGSGTLLCLAAVVTRGQGFRVGLRFVRPTTQQRLLLSELCHS
jgi:hypothetical protein